MEAVIVVFKSSAAIYRSIARSIAQQLKKTRSGKVTRRTSRAATGSPKCMFVFRMLVVNYAGEQLKVLLTVKSNGKSQQNWIVSLWLVHAVGGQ